MKINFHYLDEFVRRAKVLRKKYPSFDQDYQSFLDEMERHPFSGESLGQHTFKVRMAIASKGKGKSGGARVITYNLQKKDEDEIDITLMTIYDKSEIANVSNAYLRSLVGQLEKGEL